MHTEPGGAHSYRYLHLFEGPDSSESGFHFVQLQVPIWIQELWKTGSQTSKEAELANLALQVRAYM
jgi:hypothetical protein